MNFGFWKQLKRPLSVLAPMSGYTDAAYRSIICRYGKPDVMYTEFVPADGLCSPGRDNLAHYMWFAKAEYPVVAQLYGGNPDSFRRSAELIVSLGFAGIDVNMGCPARAVESRSGGSALIKEPARAREIIEATMAGAGNLPVSVKTRLGYATNELETWIPWLLSSKPAALILHARTREDDYDVPASWENIERAVSIARELASDEEHRTLIIGNGDVRNLGEVLQRSEATGCDGVMVGRGSIGNPWFFSQETSKQELSLSEVLAVIIEHTEQFLQHYGEDTRIDRLRKHFKAYIAGFPRTAALRAKLMQADNVYELKLAVREACAEPAGLRRMI